MKKPIEKSRKMVRMFTSVPLEVKEAATKKAAIDQNTTEDEANSSAWLRILIERNV